MLNVNFALRNKTTQELLNLEITTESWDDGMCIQSSSEYSIENDGNNGLWTTDSLFNALAVLSSLSSINTEEYPRIYNEAKNLEIVAIHSFSDMIQAVTSDNVPQNIHDFITSDDIIIAKSTSFYGEFDEYKYNLLKAELEKGENTKNTLKMEYSTVYVLGETLKKANRIPVIEPDVALIQSVCTNCLESLSQL